MQNQKRRLSYSGISTFKQCRKNFYYAYDLKLEPKLVRPEVSIGRAIHEALEDFYSLDPENRTHDILNSNYEKSMTKTFAELDTFMGGLESKEKEKFEKDQAKGKTWIDNYWHKYKQDDSIPKAITEKLFEIDMGDFVLVIKPDAIVKKDDETWVLEHKSGNPDIQQLLMEDEQSLYYVFGLRKLGYDAKGTIYNLISNPTRTSDGLEREEIERTDLELLGLEHEVRQIAKEIATLPRYPNRGRLCSWCFYRELCRAEWFGGDVEYLISKDFNKKGVS